VKGLIGTMIAAVVGLALVAAPSAGRAQGAMDLDKVELMLHGVTAVYTSTVMAMNAYRSGLLTKDEAVTEIARNEAFLVVLAKCGRKLEREAAPDEHEDISFAQDFVQVCNYLQFAIESFTTFVSEGNELDRKLFDRYLSKGEETMDRLLKEFSGG